MPTALSLSSDRAAASLAPCAIVPCRLSPWPHPHGHISTATPRDHAPRPRPDHAPATLQPRPRPRPRPCPQAVLLGKHAAEGLPQRWLSRRAGRPGFQGLGSRKRLRGGGWLCRGVGRTCGPEDARVAEAVAGSEGLHHAVDLLGLTWQPEGPQELPGRGAGGGQRGDGHPELSPGTGGVRTCRQ